MELLLLCIALYCYLWQAPLYTHNVEVLFFFLPYYFTAALPTSVALFWKRTRADPVRAPPYATLWCFGHEALAARYGWL